MSTGFSLPPVTVDHDENWIAVDLGGDLGDWARRTARYILSRAPGRHSRQKEKHMASVLEQAGAIARRSQDASMALLLAPGVNDTIKAVVRFCPVDLSGKDEDEAWTELISALSADEPPDVTEVTSPAGRCRRIRQRYAAGEGPERPVGQHLNYVWVLPRWGAAVIMATSFDDLMEAGRWQPALDKLAAGVSLEPDTATGPGTPPARSR